MRVREGRREREKEICKKENRKMSCGLKKVKKNENKKREKE